MNKADRELLNAIAADLEQEVCPECNGDRRTCLNCFKPVTECACGAEVEPITCGECEGTGMVPQERPDYTQLDGPALLNACGDDAAIWAAAFSQMAIKLGYSDMDEGWLIGWFANAIEHSWDVRTRSCRLRS